MVRRGTRIAALLWMVSQPLAIPALACVQCCLDEAREADAAAGPSGGEHAACHRPVPSEADECRLSAACSGPMAALAAMLDAQGELPQTAAAAHAERSVAAPATPGDRLPAVSSRSDSPPPRS